MTKTYKGFDRKGRQIQMTVPEREQDMKTYNGWTNYETWCVSLWIDNDEGSYRATRDWMQELWDAHGNAADLLPGATRSQATRICFADWLKEFVSDNQPDLGASVWTDLLTAALDEVNWSEIADNYLSELDGYDVFDAESK